MALDGEDLTDAGKVEVVVEAGRGPNRALLDAAMGQGGRLAEVGRSAVFEDQPDGVMKRGLIVLGHEDIMGLAFNGIGGQLALGQQGIGGEGLAGDVEGVEDGDGHPALVGLFDRIALAYGEGTDFFWV